MSLLTTEGGNMRAIRMVPVLTVLAIGVPCLAWAGYFEAWTQPNMTLALNDSKYHLGVGIPADIDNDGRRELVRSDSYHFRIYDFLTGVIKYEYPLPAGGQLANTFVFDIDGDGYCEVYLQLGDSSNPTAGSRLVMLRDDHSAGPQASDPVGAK